MCSRFWLILLVILAVEALIAIASVVTEEAYRAEAFVRMGEVVDDDAGMQGAAVQKARDALEGLPVTFQPRPGSTVMIVAEGNSREQAKALAERGYKVLFECNQQFMDHAMKKYQIRVGVLESTIAELKAEIRELSEIRSKTVGQVLNATEDMAAFNLVPFIELHHELKKDLVKAKLKLEDSVIQPVLLAEPTMPATPFRPRWGRNLVLGAAFGLAFGVFVLALLGVFQQIGEVAKL